MITRAHGLPIRLATKSIPCRAVVDRLLVYSSGSIASGPPGWSRQPLPWMPPKLRLLRTEGAGEVQTPLRGAAAAELQVGDQVWFRHAKAGELCDASIGFISSRGTRSSTTCRPLGVRGGTSGE